MPSGNFPSAIANGFQQAADTITSGIHQAAGIIASDFQQAISTIASSFPQTTARRYISCSHSIYLKESIKY